MSTYPCFLQFTNNSGGAIQMWWLSHTANRVTQTMCGGPLASGATSPVYGSCVVVSNTSDYWSLYYVDSVNNLWGVSNAEQTLSSGDAPNNVISATLTANNQFTLSGPGTSGTSPITLTTQMSGRLTNPQLYISPTYISLANVSNTANTQTLTAYFSGTDVTSSVQFASGNNSVATVSGNVVTAAGAGATTISATYTDTGGHAYEVWASVTIGTVLIYAADGNTYNLDGYTLSPWTSAPTTSLPTVSSSAQTAQAYYLPTAGASITCFLLNLNSFHPSTGTFGEIPR